MTDPATILNVEKVTEAARHLVPSMTALLNLPLDERHILIGELQTWMPEVRQAAQRAIAEGIVAVLNDLPCDGDRKRPKHARCASSTRKVWCAVCREKVKYESEAARLRGEG